MRGLLVRVVLALAALVTAVTAVAQRGRGAHVDPPHRIAEKAAEAARADAFHDETDRRTGILNKVTQDWNLRPTKENFARLQAGKIYLDQFTGLNWDRGPEDLIRASNLINGQSNAYFPALKHLAEMKRPTAQPHTGIAVLDFLPKDESQFQSVFGREWTAADQSKLQRAKQFLRDRDPTLSPSLNAALDASDLPIVVLVGHNDAGWLVGPDGSKTSLLKIGESCVAKLKLCIFAVCKSQEQLGSTAIGMKGNLSLVSGGKLASDIVEIVQRYQADPSARAPYDMVYDIIDRVDAGGNIIRLIGRQARGGFDVHLVMVIVRCTAQDVC